MTAPNLLAPGSPAPPFALPDASGTARKLHDFKGHPLVLFFYPRADTPGCTLEAQDFTARLAEFSKHGCAVVGISADPPAKLARFADKRAIGVTLLSDESHETLNAYGVWGEKSLYGKRFEGILRSSYLVGKDGRVIEAWRVAKVAGHAETVLNSVRKIP